MRKSLITVLVLCMFLSSCGQAKQENKSIQQNILPETSEKELKALVFKTELNKEEKLFIKERANGFDERVKQYAIYYGPKSTPEDSKKKSEEMCRWILNNIEELSTQAVSRERERERERESSFYSDACDFKKLGYLSYRTPSQYWELVKKKIPNSAQPYINETVRALGEESRKGNFVYPLKHYLNLKQAATKDPEDLMSYYEIVTWYQNGLRDKNGKDLIQEDYKEYCQKAIELEQWDHIYYLSKGEPSGITRGINYIERCLEVKPNEYNYNYCKCPEATKIIVGKWPKDVLYDGYMLDPSGEDENGDQREGAIQRINDLMKKHFGRDLDKEPKVYFYKGDPGR
jgi:hypothetical protein